MAEDINVVVVGDRDPGNLTHTATEGALEHAGAALGTPVATEWLPTDAPEGSAPRALRAFDAVFCSPGSPYRSLDGALEAIRYARENGIPFIGTCGGFQHVVIEYARNVLGFPEAGHTEYDPDASNPFVSALSCSPFGQKMRVRVEPGSRSRDAYGDPEVEEEYRCNYGLEPGSRGLLEEGGLCVSGTEADGEVRILELPGHPFYVATLFVPQLRSSFGKPHPLILAFVRAGLEARKKKGARTNRVGAVRGPSKTAHP